MAQRLWTPSTRPGGPNLPRAGLPTGDLRLADGRWLRYAEAWSPTADMVIGGRWTGPKRLHVLGSLDHTPHGDLLHLSISYPDHDPSWEDIRQVRYAFFPSTVDCMMMLPRDQDYVNLHPHVFHLTQTPTAWGLR